jgi:hypothetical protein
MREAHEWDPPVDGAPEDAEAVLQSRLGGELEHLIEFVRMGHEAELFLAKNPVGRYLVEQAKSELEAALKELLDMDSVRGKKARDVFDRAKRARSVLTWIDSAITAGLEAEQAIAARDISNETPQ